MKIKNVKVYGLEESIIRSGYPMQTGEPKDLPLKGDLRQIYKEHDKRAIKLAKVPSGTGHDNFLKGIIVQFDLQYPEYFSPQLQRYNRVDIVSSQSKMHKITSRGLTKNDFEPEVGLNSIKQLNQLIEHYNNTNNSDVKQSIFKNILANLPSGYLKWMGITTNYLQLKTIYSQRRKHKLKEWQYFCEWIESLPMKQLIINYENTTRYNK